MTTQCKVSRAQSELNDAIVNELGWLVFTKLCQATELLTNTEKDNILVISNRIHKQYGL